MSFRRAFLVLAGLGGLGTWALYPRYLTTVDERGYWEYSRWLRRGELREWEPFAPGKFTFRGWPWQPPLNALALAPFPSLDWALARGFLLHLGIALLAGLLAGELGFALAALWPPLVLYSRTLMPEPLAFLLLLLGYYFWRKRPFVSGLLVGLAALARYQAAPAAALLAAWELWRGRREFAAGALVGLALLAAWTLVAYGGLPPISGPYNLGFAPRNLGFLLMSASLVYPMMFLGLLRLELPWALAAGAYALACLPMGILDWAGGMPGDLVSGVRLYLPPLGLALVGYGRLLREVNLTPLAVAVGLLGSWGVAVKHQERLRVYREIAGALRRTVKAPAYGNREALRFLGSKLRLEPKGDERSAVYVGFPRRDEGFEAFVRDIEGKTLLDTVIGGPVLVKELIGKIPK